METIEPKNGEVINYDGVNLKCVEGRGCSGCFFQDCDCGHIICNSSSREDGISVRLIKQENEALEKVDKF